MLRFSGAAYGFVRGQQGEHHDGTERSTADERHAPWRELLQRRQPCERAGGGGDEQVARDGNRQTLGQRLAGQIDADRAPAIIRREQVCDHRDCSGRERGFAEAYENARQEQFAEAARVAGENRGGAPDGDADDDQPAARIPVCHQAERQADGGIEEAECQALQQAELHVCQREICLQGLGDDAEDIAIEYRDDRREKQDREQPPRLAAIRPGQGFRRRRRADHRRPRGRARDLM